MSVVSRGDGKMGKGYVRAIMVPFSYLESLSKGYTLITYQCLKGPKILKIKSRPLKGSRFPEISTKICENQPKFGTNRTKTRGCFVGLPFGLEIVKKVRSYTQIRN